MEGGESFLVLREGRVMGRRNEKGGEKRDSEKKKREKREKKQNKRAGAFK